MCRTELMLSHGSLRQVCGGGYMCEEEDTCVGRN
jgi:hypothetical protein